MDIEFGSKEHIDKKLLRRICSEQGKNKLD